MPTLSTFRLVLSKLCARLRRLLLECVERGTFEDSTAFLSESSIEAYFALSLTVAISLHQTDILPSLLRAVQVTNADKIKGFVLQAHADFLCLSHTQLGKLATLMTLNDLIKVSKCLSMSHQPEIN